MLITHNQGMKNIFVILASILFLSNCFAQEPQTTSTPTETPATPPAPSPTPIAEPKPTSDHKTKVSIFAFYNTANSMTFSDIKETTGGVTYSGDATFYSDMAPGFGIEIFVAPENHWGWSAGLTYDSTRNLNSANAGFSGQSVSVVYADPKPTISFVTVYGNAIYRWDSFYLPFGLNVTSPTYKSSDGTITTVTGTLGTQGGAGFFVNDHFSIEGLLRLVEFNVTRSSSTFYIDYGTGAMYGAQLNLKFIF